MLGGRGEEAVAGSVSGLGVQRVPDSQTGNETGKTIN